MVRDIDDESTAAPLDASIYGNNGRGGASFIDDDDDNRKRRILPPSEIDVEKKEEEQQPLFNKLVCDDLWDNDKSVVTAALSKLADLCCGTISGSDVLENRRVIFRAGGHLAIIKSMERHSDDAGIQDGGCRVLTNLMVKNGENKNGIVDAGGIRVTIQAMKRFPAEEALQESGCALLQNLVTDKTIKKRFMQQDGHVAVIDAMKQLPSNVGIQSRGCVALYSLGGDDPSSQKTLEKAGAISALAAALENCVEDDFTQKWSRKALKRFFSK